MIIEATNIDITMIWVDGWYATHSDMRSNTGECYHLGRGVTHHKPSKQKSNIRSSTEAGLVCASGYVAYIVWMGRFLKH